MKKILISLMVLMSIFVLTACDKVENVEGNLEEIMDKVYTDIPEDERPMMLTNIEITEENIESYLGTKNINYKEAIASESGVGSIAHSVVLIRMNDDADLEKTKEEIKKNINPRKWICVEAEEVKITNKGNLIIVVMSSKNNTEKLINSFNNL